jgi:hypothetical protein
VTIRGYQPGDERDIVRLFQADYGSFSGPTKLTPATWRQTHERGWWNRPSVLEDPESVRVLVRGEKVVGYVVFHQRRPKEGHAYLQELCVADVPEREDLARLLIEDAMLVLRRRGVNSGPWMLSPADPFASSLADEFGFLKLVREPTVFMARVVVLEALLRELAPSMSQRLRASDLQSWSGTVLFDLDGDSKRSETKQSALRIGRRAVTVMSKLPARPTLTVRTDQETLCRLAMGALRVVEAYQQDWLSARPTELALGERTCRSLELLDVLFPENRWTLPRAHSW